jgi:OFA family oxalate/formate antiporter-like MFS transporter
VAICFCAGGLYGWSALVSIVESVFAATTEQAALVFSVSIVSFSLAVFAVPRFSSYFTGLSGCALFGLSGASSLLIASLSNSYEMFLPAFSVGFGFSSGAIYINALTIASASNRPTLATPVMVAAFSLGGAVFGPLWRVMASTGWGLSSLLVLAGALALCSLAVFTVLLGRTTVDSKNTVDAQRGNVSDNRLILLLLWLTFALGSAGGLMVLGLASKIIDIAGGTVGISSAALAGIAIGNTLGRLSVGVMANVVSPIVVALLSTVVVCCGLTISGLASSASMSIIGLVATATGYGLLASAMPTLVGSLFGKHVFAHFFSIVFTAWGVAGLVAPWIAGVIFDNTGSFDVAILAALISTVGACMTLLVLMIYLKRKTISIADY